MNIESVLKSHAAWLRGERGGKRANLQEADLQGANLYRAALREADLQGANLQGAKLQGAKLQGAKLQWAKLQGANLQWARLQGARLQGADLQGANLQWANLQGARLQGADLQGAKGIIDLPVSEPRGYRWVAVMSKSGWRISARCQWFTLAEARDHWLSPEYDGPQSVKDTAGFALDYIEAQPLL